MTIWQDWQHRVPERRNIDKELTFTVCLFLVRVSGPTFGADYTAKLQPIMRDPKVGQVPPDEVPPERNAPHPNKRP